MEENFNRRLEDIGNVIALEHINLCVPDQRLATLFYISGLGLTRDPYLVTSVANMWVNIGRNQFHLPTRDPLVIRGTIGLVIPERRKLLDRLRSIEGQLKDTKFSFKSDKILCPLPARGETVFGYTHRETVRQNGLGIAYIEFDVPKNSAKGIAQFYQEHFSTLGNRQFSGCGCEGTGWRRAKTYFPRNRPQNSCL